MTQDKDRLGRVCILGVCAMDFVFTGSRLPIMGETLQGSGFYQSFGGKGSNQAITVSRCGGKATLLSSIAKDGLYEQFKQLYVKENIDDSYMIEVEANVDKGMYSSVAFIFVDDNSGDNGIIISPGVAKTITKAHIQQAKTSFTTSAVFITQLETPIATGAYALQLAKESGCITILNPAPAVPLPDTIFAHIDIITPNQTEVQILTGIQVTNSKTAQQACHILRAKGAKTVIITMGNKGAYVQSDDLEEWLPAFTMDNIIDTTGAGDAFNGGLAYALAHDQPLQQAVRYGCAVAALAVTKKGAGNGMPYKQEIDQLLNKGN